VYMCVCVGGGVETCITFLLGSLAGRDDREDLGVDGV
jgi:hypothetical protein